MLAAWPGFRSGRIGRAADDPSYWIMATEWEHVGAYRRALSAYEVRVHAVPLLSLAVDEPSAYEVLVSTGLGARGRDATGRSDRASDADAVGLGHASGPSADRPARLRPPDLARGHPVLDLLARGHPVPTVEHAPGARWQVP